MKKIFYNIVLLCMGIVFSLLIVEAVLFVTARVYYASHVRLKAGVSDGPHVIRIMCLGDSFTFGMGAPRGYSYPAQLQRYLQQCRPDKEFEIYNAGLPGSTSSQALSRLQKGLFGQFKPDILLILVGVNDPDSTEKTSYYLFKKENQYNPFYLMECSLGKFRFGRLLGLGIDNLLVMIWKRQIIAKYGPFFSSYQAKPPRCCYDGSPRADEYWKHINLAGEHFNKWERDSGAAIEQFNKAIALIPACDNAYTGLANIYVALSDKKEYPGVDFIIQLLEQSVRYNPSSTDAYRLLWHVYYRSGKTVLAREALEKFLYWAPEAIPEYLRVFKYGLPWFDERQAYLDLFAQNLSEMIDFARERGVKVALLEYPDGSEFSRLTKNIAREKNVPFVENLTFFKKLKKQPGYQRNEYFVEDNHCTAKGYAVMAENAAAAVIGKFLK